MTRYKAVQGENTGTRVSRKCWFIFLIGVKKEWEKEEVRNSKWPENGRKSK